MNDSILIEAIQTPVSEYVNEAARYSIDWTAMGFFTLTCFLPLLMLFCYLGYRLYLKNQRKRLNDDLIVRLAQQGQTLTPEMIEAVRKDEKTQKDASQNAPAQAYNKLCTGGAMIVAGIVVCIRNRVFGLILLIAGLFVAAQGLAIWLSNRKDDSTTPQFPDSTNLQ